MKSLKPPAATIKDRDLTKSALLSEWDEGFLFGRQGDVPTFSHSSDRLGTFVRLFLVPLLMEVS